jgi:hypothetical protein
MTDGLLPPLNDFIAVSVCLTGVVSLDADLAEEYLERVHRHPQLGPSLGALVARYQEFVGRPERPADGSQSADRAQPAEIEEAAGAQLMADPELGPLASQLIYLWYAGAFFEADLEVPGRSAWDYGANPEHYGRGLMWSVIRAHAPMTPWPDTPDASRVTPDAANLEPYWTQEPDVTAPVTVPPRWFAVESDASSDGHARREVP